MPYKINPLTGKFDYYQANTPPVTPDVIVRFNTADPNVGSPTFIDSNGNVTVGGQLNTLYVSTVNNSQWTYDGSVYETYTIVIPDSTPFYLKDTLIDAGNNKVAPIERTGSIKLTTGSFIGSHAGNGFSLTNINPQSILYATLPFFAIAATTGALPASTYAANAITASANGVLPAQDGVTLQVGQDVLIKDEAIASRNGLYTVTSLGSVSSKFSLYRKAGYDNSLAVYPSQINIASGTVNARKIFFQTTANPTIGSSNLIFSELVPINIFNSNGSLIGDRTITSNGYMLSLVADVGQQSRLVLDSVNNTASILSFRTANLPRWALRKDGDETGSNVGGDFAIRRYDDAGAYIDSPVSIKRNTGVITLNGAYALPTTAPTAGKVLGYSAPGVSAWVDGASSGKFGIANSSGVYTYYSTLTLAMAAAVSGDTICQFANITETGNVSITWKDGVNFNGNNYTYTNSYASGDCNAIAFPTGTLNSTFSNWRLIRSGRVNDTATDYAMYVRGTNAYLQFNSVYIESTYGNAVYLNTSSAGSTYRGTLYGKGRLKGIELWECEALGLSGESTASNAGIYLVGGSSTGQFLFGKSVSNYGIYNQGSLYNCIGKSTSNSGIYGGNNYNCTGVSVSGPGISGNLYSCVGISTSNVALDGNSINCTGITSSGNAWSSIFSGYFIKNSYLESSSNNPVYAVACTLENNNINCKWNNASGHAVNLYYWQAGYMVSLISNNTIQVANASAYGITGYAGNTMKAVSNIFKGMTAPVNTTNVTQQQINTHDNYGNILM